MLGSQIAEGGMVTWDSTFNIIFLVCQRVCAARILLRDRP